LVGGLLEVEFPHREGEPTVGREVGIAEQREPRPELFGFGKRLAVKEADSNQLPCRLDQDLVAAGLEHVDSGDFDLLVNLLGLQLVVTLSRKREPGLE
jgi:hypothetical protein